MEEADMDRKKLTIVMTTYFPEGEVGQQRLKAVTETVNSWDQYFSTYADVMFHIADDGSDPFVLHKFILKNFGEDKVTWSQQSRKGVGASLNTGFRKAYERSPYVFYGVDDWALDDHFRFDPWLRLLEERDDVGMVRLGPPHPNTFGKIEMLTEEWQGWALRLNRYAYAYGQRPALYHKRFTDAYGWFKEGVSAIDCEREYAEHFVRTSGPDIVLALPHPWKHIDTVSMSDMTPGV